MVGSEQVKTCEVCGNQATTLVQDIREKETMTHQWREFERDGELHRFCNTHTRDSVTKSLSD